MIRRPCFYFLLGFGWPLVAQQPTYLNPDLVPEKRAADLVSRMTLGEKVLQMQNNAPAIPRLGVIPYNWWSEALHGVARQGIATVFPQAIGMAATWDTDLIHRVADAISTEARAKYNESLRTKSRIGGLTFWSPNINIFRDPRWGRGQETYGEDPYLTGRMAVAFVKGMQGSDPKYLKVVATPKHFAVHSGPEATRHTVDVHPSGRDLMETYLPAFRAAVTEGKAYSVMCAYNAVDGAPVCANADLIQKRLRGEWGFQGYVVSDCGAIGDIFRGHKYAAGMADASAIAVKTGTDLTCGSEYRSLVDAVKAGFITEAEIDRSAERLFTARMKLGEFDPPERVAYARIAIAENDTAEHRKLALETARKSIVLLKNGNQTLPLKPSVRSIAVIGPGADDAVGPLGNYNGTPSSLVTPLAGIRNQFAGKAEIHAALGSLYAPGSVVNAPADVFTAPAGGGKGLRVEYFDNANLEGQPRITRVDPQVFTPYDQLDPSVTSAIPRAGSSARWTGLLRAPYTGAYSIAAGAGAATRVFIDGKDIFAGAAPAAPAGGGSNRGQASVDLEAGRAYDVRIEYRPAAGRSGAGGGPALQLQWAPPTGALRAEAIAAVKNSDVTVAFVGINANLEGEEMRVSIPGFEGGDRTSLDLPEQQEQLVRAAIDTGKPVVVVLLSGSALAANYEQERASAVLEAWYGGEEIGTAIAETLAGANNPAGRLPVTFYKSVDQLPAFAEYAMKGRTYRYFTGDPLYPFGFGLSYSTFRYSNLSAKRSGNGASVSVRVKNDSNREGDEVVQLYVGGAGGPDDPIRSLRGFQRVHLAAGETRQVQFTLTQEDLPKARTRISVGGGQPAPQVPHLEATL